MKKLVLIITLGIFISCSNDSTTSTSVITATETPDGKFTITDTSIEGLSYFSKQITVFNIPIVAAPGVEIEKFAHAANVMAQYIDNDADGTPDNLSVNNSMIDNNATLIMWKNENDLNQVGNFNGIGQDLGADETNPSFVINGNIGEFDASLEEVLHIITNAGYGYSFPSAFGENQSSEIARAMNIARGGVFTSIPSNYPADAWYTYDDPTCGYNCQISEYFYWALTSILGAQENRLSSIQQEWKLNTRAKVMETDTSAYSLMTNNEYNLPTILPNGNYTINN